MYTHTYIYINIYKHFYILYIYIYIYIYIERERERERKKESDSEEEIIIVQVVHPRIEKQNNKQTRNTKIWRADSERELGKADKWQTSDRVVIFHWVRFYYFSSLHLSDIL